MGLSLIGGAITGIKFLVKVPWRKISKEGKEAIETVKAVKIDGVNDRAEIEKAFKEVLDVADLIFPNIKNVYNLLHKDGK